MEMSKREREREREREAGPGWKKGWSALNSAWNRNRLGRRRRRRESALLQRRGDRAEKKFYALGASSAKSGRKGSSFAFSSVLRLFHPVRELQFSSAWRGKKVKAKKRAKELLRSLFAS